MSSDSQSKNNTNKPSVIVSNTENCGQYEVSVWTDLDVSHRAPTVGPCVYYQTQANSTATLTVRLCIKVNNVTYQSSYSQRKNTDDRAE